MWIWDKKTFDGKSKQDLIVLLCNEICLISEQNCIWNNSSEMFWKVEIINPQRLLSTCGECQKQFSTEDPCHSAILGAFKRKGFPQISDD